MTIVLNEKQQALLDSFCEKNQIMLNDHIKEKSIETKEDLLSFILRSECETLICNMSILFHTFSDEKIELQDFCNIMKSSYEQTIDEFKRGVLIRALR